MSTLPYNTPLSAEDSTLVDGSLTTAEQKLPQLIALTPLQRRRRRKLGFKTDKFSRRAVELASNKLDVLPRGLDLAQLEADIATRDVLLRKLDRVQSLAQRLQDTAMQIGADIFDRTRTIYNSIQRSGAPEGMEAALEELGQVFKRKRKAKTPATGDTGSGSTTGGTAGA